MANTEYIQVVAGVWQRFAATSPRQFIGAETLPDGEDQYLEMKWADTLYFRPSIPAALRKKSILGVETRSYAKGIGETCLICVRLLTEPYDAARIAAGETVGDADLIVTGNASKNYFAAIYSNGFPNPADVVNGFAVSTTAQPDSRLGLFGMEISEYVEDTEGYNRSDPQLLITYEDAVLAPSGVFPAGGAWVDRSQAVTLSWTPATDAVTIDAPQQASAIVQWKDGAEGTVHTIAAGTAHSVTLAANTLPVSSDIRWRVTITSDDGVTDPAPQWFTFATIDSVPTVTPVSPREAYITADADVTFVWDYSVSTGAPQTAYELQIRARGADTWEALASGSGAETSANVAASALPSGAAEWRVRAANTDGVYSAWSAAAPFVMLAAPATPVVTVTRPTPVPVVAWQAAAQIGYQVQVAGWDSGAVWGTEKTLTPPIILDDGRYTARVRIISSLGVWGAWGETDFVVQNDDGGGEVTLSASGGVDVSLVWYASAAAERYAVYRDGALIAETAAAEYADRLHLGAASYTVRAVLADGNYIMSNAAEAAAATDTVLIAAEDGAWIDIGLSDTELPTVTQTMGADVTLLSLAGTVYPAAVRSPRRSRTYGVAFATTDAATGEAFEALLGRTVILKDRGGTVVHGVMAEIARGQNEFLRAYTATLTETEPYA